MDTTDRRETGSDPTRHEDEPLLTGAAAFTDDLSAANEVYLHFIRSSHGHAKVEGIDAARARSLDGVLAVFTWNDVVASDAPGKLPVWGLDDCDAVAHPLLARKTVRYHGQPIAAVVAEEPAIARDAAAATTVSYDVLDSVTDPTSATTEPAPSLFQDVSDNVATVTELGDEERAERALAASDHTISLTIENNRVIPTTLEPRAALARYAPVEGKLTVEVSTQTPHVDRGNLSATLGVPERDVRVVAPEVGGGFGHKSHQYPDEVMTAWCALELERPVKWTATRSENSIAGAHGRDHVTEGTIAVDDCGTIRGLSVETTANLGGYPLGDSPAVIPLYGRLLSGQYRIPAVFCRTRCVFTNTAPIHTYRGAGIPEAIYVIERLIDAAARELAIDPVELRRRNQLAKDSFPYENGLGATYDSGDYEAALETALDAVDYETLRERQRTLREKDRYLGIGVGCFVESTGRGAESGRVTINPSGEIVVYAGTQSQGQGHETTYAQIVADEFDVRPRVVQVIEGDTDRIAMGWGTFGSRSTVTAGNAVAECARDLLTKAKRIAAHQLDSAPEEVTVTDGQFRVDDDPDRSMSLEDVARFAYSWDLPDDVDAGLESATYFQSDGETYSFGTHVAVAEVDPETGEIDLRRYVAVTDCGNQINPTIVEGQVHGGVAQGIGQALFEHAVYDEGRLVTDSLQEYAVPRANQLPEIETAFTVTPSPLNPLGVKGVGEAGTIAAPPTIVNAVVDALEPFEVESLDMPLTDETVWNSVHEG